MPDYHFNADFRELATLRDGSRAQIRLVRPEDKEQLRRGFERLSPESRYRRFFSAKVRLSERELRYLTDLDQVDHVAIGAEYPAESGDARGLGVARFIRDPDRRDTAEAAITVIDDAQGKGLGSLLFQRLVAAARERDITRLRFEVLSDNRPMLRFLQDVAPDSTVRHDGRVSSFEFELPELSPSHPADEPPRGDPLYRILTKVAEGAVEMDGAFSRSVMRASIKARRDQDSD